MSDAQSYPLHWPDGWPRTDGYKRRAHSAFRTTFLNARVALFHELKLLKAENVILSTNLELKLDGMPYAEKARKTHPDPGAAIYFTLRGRPMVIARDAYDNVHDNVRSLGLAIAYMRGLERHGGATMMERAFSGMAALPAPDAKTPWRDILGDCNTLDDAKASFRRQAKIHHPDTADGNQVMFQRVSQAWEDAQRELGQ